MRNAIEVEYWVVDDDGALASPGPLTDVSEYTEVEFVEPLFELKTPPCTSCEELRETFLDQLAEVLSVADALGKSLVPLGTPIHGEYIEQLDDERSRIQREVLGTNFDFAKYCAGTHVHFEKRNVTDQLNALIALDPAMALVNSSPYFQGEWVADGARAYLYRKRSYEEFPKHGQLWDYVETVAEWERRLDHRYEEFEAAAGNAGISAETVAENFTRDNVVWTPVRLREEMPTVEWRSPDATLPSEILRLVESLDAVMEHVHNANVRIDGEMGDVGDDEIVLPAFGAVCEYAEEAITHGAAAPDVAGYLGRMGFDVDAFDPISRRFRDRRSVSPSEARALRLEYSELLRRDVERLRNGE